MPSDQLDILCSVETWALAPVSSLDGFTGDDGVKYGYCSTATELSLHRGSARSISALLHREEIPILYKTKSRDNVDKTTKP